MAESDLNRPDADGSDLRFTLAGDRPVGARVPALGPVNVVVIWIDSPSFTHQVQFGGDTFDIAIYDLSELTEDRKGTTSLGR